VIRHISGIAHPSVRYVLLTQKEKDVIVPHDSSNWWGGAEIERHDNAVPDQKLSQKNLSTVSIDSTVSSTNEAWPGGRKVEVYAMLLHAVSKKHPRHFRF